MVNYTSTNTQFDILNLDPYELVEVRVSASNRAGGGPRSPGVRGRTREERKSGIFHTVYCSGTQIGAYVSLLICMKTDLHVQPQVL